MQENSEDRTIFQVSLSWFEWAIGKKDLCGKRNLFTLELNSRGEQFPVEVGNSPGNLSKNPFTEEGDTFVNLQGEVPKGYLKIHSLYFRRLLAGTD